MQHSKLRERYISYYDIIFRKVEGIPVTYVEPKNTSKECSRCGSIGIREGKSFKCPSCGHVDHADVNASFNIALRPPSVGGIGQLHADRDACKGSTDTPRGATLRTTETPEPPSFSEESMSESGLDSYVASAVAVLKAGLHLGDAGEMPGDDRASTVSMAEYFP
jgi:hypothetical protein